MDFILDCNRNIFKQPSGTSSNIAYACTHLRTYVSRSYLTRETHTHTQITRRRRIYISTRSHEDHKASAKERRNALRIRDTCIDASHSHVQTGIKMDTDTQLRHATQMQQRSNSRKHVHARVKHATRIEQQRKFLSYPYVREREIER